MSNFNNTHLNYLQLALEDTQSHLTQRVEAIIFGAGDQLWQVVSIAPAFAMKTLLSAQMFRSMLKSPTQPV